MFGVWACMGGKIVFWNWRQGKGRGCLLNVFCKREYEKLSSLLGFFSENLLSFACNLDPLKRHEWKFITRMKIISNVKWSFSLFFFVSIEKNQANELLLKHWQTINIIITRTAKTKIKQKMKMMKPTKAT